MEFFLHEYLDKKVLFIENISTKEHWILFDNGYRADFEKRRPSVRDLCDFPAKQISDERALELLWYYAGSRKTVYPGRILNFITRYEDLPF